MYRCISCGYGSSTELGKCPACNEWGTFAKAVTPKKKMSGQKEMFEEIWKERPHHSELSGKKLLGKSHPQWHHQFLHVLNKGRYPHYKLNKDNILLALPEEHDRQDEFEVFKNKQQILTQEYYEKYNVKRK